MIMKNDSCISFGLKLVFLLSPLLFRSFATAQDAPQTSSHDPGCFLSWEQKGQLIWRGRMQDSAGLRNGLELRRLAGDGSGGTEASPVAGGARCC